MRPPDDTDHEAPATGTLLLIGHGFLGRALSGLFRDAGWDVAAVSRGAAMQGGHGCGAPPSSVTDHSSGSLGEFAVVVRYLQDERCVVGIG